MFKYTSTLLPAMFTACSLGLMPLPFVQAQTTQPSGTEAKAPASQERIEQLIQWMGDDNYEMREEATEALWRLGDQAIPALEKATKSDNTEIVWRAKEILNRLKFGIRHDTPEEVLKLITTFRSISNRTDEQNVVKRLSIFIDLAEIGEQGFLPFTRLMGLEKNPRLISQVKNIMDVSGFYFTSDALKRGDIQQAKAMYRQMAILGSSTAAQNYITFLKLTGQLEKEITDIERLGMEHPNKNYMTALAYYALGKNDRAIELASLEDNQALFNSMLIDLGKWEALLRDVNPEALAVPNMRATTSVAQMAFITQTLNKQVEYEALLKQLTGLVENAPERQKPLIAQVVTNHLLFLGEPEKARNYIMEYQLKGAADFQESTLKLGSALKMNEAELEKSKGNDFINIAFNLIRINERLGNKERALTVLEALDKDLTGAERESNLWLLVIYYRNLGQEEKANEIIYKTIKDYSDDPYLVREFVSYLFDSSIQIELAGFWMERLSAQQGTDKPNVLFKALDDLVRVKMDPVALKSLIQSEIKRIEAELERAQRDFEKESLFRQYSLLGDTWELYNKNDEAMKHFEKAIPLFPDDLDNTKYRLARLKILNKDYLAAADLMMEIYKNSKDRRTLGLAAEVLLAGGKKEKGEALLTWYNSIVLSDARERLQLIATLQSMKMDAAAYKHMGLMSSVLALPHSIDPVTEDRDTYFRTLLLYQAHKQLLANQYYKPREDYKTAARYLNAVEFTKYREGFIEHSNFFNLDYSSIDDAASKRLSMQLVAKVKEGKLDEVEERFKRYIKGNANAVDFSIDVLSVMKNEGHDEKAEALFKELYAGFAPYMKKYPNNAMERNNLAWVSATSHVGMKEGLKLSEEAVKLEPKTTAYLDTLAELKFQTGNTEEAVKLMKKCVDKEPFRRYYQAQYQRMLKGDPTVPCPRHIPD